MRANPHSQEAKALKRPFWIGILKWTTIVVGVPLAASVPVLGGSYTLTTLPGELTTPSGLKRNQALYVRMPDGVRIAIDVWLPKNYHRGRKLPAILLQTRYQRAQEIGPLQRALIGLGLIGTDADLPLETRMFNDAGYAFIRVDARGSGASFGNRRIEMSPEEVADYGHIVDWITRQDWSNGKVGAVGISYSGNTAELLASTGHPAVKAVAPLYNDFDAQFGLVQPGGAKTEFLEKWGGMVGAMDRNDICAIAKMSGIGCWLTKLWTKGVKPVDGKEGKALLEAALRDHAMNMPVAQGYSAVTYRDDAYGKSGLTSAAVSGYGQRGAIERSGVMFHVRTGWLDAATTDGALSRFLTFSNPQEVVISPNSHGGSFDANPFNPPEAKAMLSKEEQLVEVIDFFNRAFEKEPAVRQAGKHIRYFTVGANIWRKTDVWPPRGLTVATYYFAPDRQLSVSPATATDASDRYEADMDVSSGGRTRWHTNLGLGDVVYADRAEQDRRLLTYTSAPLKEALEITGTPVVDFHVSTSATNGVFHAYLEAVTPDGKVIYLTEGVLAGTGRKISTGTPPYQPLGPYHSFLRADAQPVEPDEVMRLSYALYATSAVVPAGYRIRIALAAADRSIFALTPATGHPVWQVYRDSVRPSKLVLPSRPFRK